MLNIKNKKLSGIINRSIVEAVRMASPPGRFLKQNFHTGLWSGIGDTRAIAKTDQAFQCCEKTRKKIIQKLKQEMIMNRLIHLVTLNVTHRLMDRLMIIILCNGQPSKHHHQSTNGNEGE